MPLATGARFGQYEILGPLGAGGMGEVYRARDTKLGRDVAVKVLPEPVANDRERLTRFAREAQALAALNHPNIATIYGVEDGSSQAIVMELVEGVTLADLMSGARAGLPLDQALPIARQIADALEAAHGRGIVHRDLKPANVKITPDGAVKVLDFGLAKTAEGRAGMSPDASNSPTFTAASAAGMIVGTAAYMSPEQAAGRATDSRADIWAFGVVLFEMLSGRRLFSGETTGHILAEVLKSEPAWETLPKTTPPEVRGLLERCLRKNARSRLRDIGDARVEIEDWLARPEKTRFVAVPSGRPRSMLMLVAAPLIVAAAAVGFAIWRKPPAIAVPTRTWEFDMGDYETRFPDYDGPVISPDGTMIAFDGNGRGRLRVRDFDTLVPRDLPGTDGAYLAFWSPDSAFIGYYIAQGTKLSVWKVPARSGAPIKICDAPTGLLFRAAWRPDGVILLNVVTGLEDARLYAVPDRGGTPEPFAAGGSEKGDALWAPVALPGDDVLYGRRRKGVSELVIARKSGPPTLVKGEPGFAALSFQNGYLIYFAGAALSARAFDPATGTFAGDPTIISPAGWPWKGNASLSADGTLVYRQMTGGSQQLEWVDRSGATLGSIGQVQEAIEYPAISPDGSRVAVTGTESGTTSIWTHDIVRGTKSRVTIEPGYQARPSWAPSADRLAFESNWHIWVQAADSAAQPQAIASSSASQSSPSWSHDGRTLFFTQYGPAQNDILFQTDGSAAQVFLATPFSECCAMQSPDGRHVAYVSDESGRYEIYVREFPGGLAKVQVSVRGGDAPRWSATGDELFFVADDTLMAVSVKHEPTFSAGLPHALFTAAKVGVDGGPQGFACDVAADGRRFVVARTITRPERHAVVIENWLAKARAGR